MNRPEEQQASESVDRIIQRLQGLDQAELRQVDVLLNQLQIRRNRPADEMHFDWPHAPTHRLGGKGTFIVTAGTANKEHYFCRTTSLDYLHGKLLEYAQRFDWQLEAWAVFSNHYHFVGNALADSKTLRPMLIELHSESAEWINRKDGTSGRRVWFNYWETKLTYEKSYLARLNYVHQNAVWHGLVRVAAEYPWCSAGWFEQTATRSQVKTIYGFKIDKLKVLDDFEVVPP